MRVRMMISISRSKLIVIFAIFMMTFNNVAMYRNVIEVYTLQGKNIPFLVTLIVVFSCAIIFLMSLVCYKYTMKPVMISLLLVSSSASYFMMTYNVVIDDVMIANMMQTDDAEVADLMNIKFFLYIFFLGVLPSFLLLKIKIKEMPFRRELFSNFKLASVSILIAASLIIMFSSYYASFFREHKILRFYANPTYYLYSTAKYMGSFYKSSNVELNKIGLDATIKELNERRKLIVLVVGETARSDRFSLNGYTRETNPELKKENISTYNNVWSCGTSTSVSVPCMFSMYDRSDYSSSKSDSTENVLDILNRVGVNVAWLDNNTGSKGVASRVLFESYRDESVNPVCDIECRDIGMLSRFSSYIKSHPKGDIFIVLHQMGNHGPAYYKRYPDRFETFQPVCKTNQLEECSREEIDNAYDNAILYTDYFLSKVISELKQYSSEFNSSMVYISDHGESLGENGLYLHGLPYMFAPDVQKKVPLITWFSENQILNTSMPEQLKNISEEYTHDNIFHTILGLLKVNTNVYNHDLDIFVGAKY